MSLPRRTRLFNYSVLMFLFFMSVAGSVWWGISKFEAAVDEEMNNYLSDSAARGTREIRGVVRDIMDIMESVAELVSVHDDFSSPVVRALISGKASGRIKRARFIVAGEKGIGYSDDGCILNVAGYKFFQTAMLGTENISDVFPSILNGKRTIAIAVPIYRDGVVKGVLSATYYENSFREMYDTSVFGRRGYSFIVDADGRVISSPAGARSRESGVDAAEVIPYPNIFHAKKEIVPITKMSWSEFEARLRRSEHGMIKYSYYGDVRYLNYTPVGINSWYLFSVVSMDAVTSRFAGFRWLGFGIVTLLALFFSAFTAVLLFMHRRNIRKIERAGLNMAMLTENIPGGIVCVMSSNGCRFVDVSDGYLALLGVSADELGIRYDNMFVNTIHIDDVKRVNAEIEKQLSVGDVFGVQYRVVRTDGCVLWVQDKGRRGTNADGFGVYYRLIVDITDEKEISDKLELSEERYRIVTEYSDEYIFEWNVPQEKLYFSAQCVRVFGDIPESRGHNVNLLFISKVHTEDRSKFMDMLRSIKKKQLRIEEEMRIRTVNGEYIWCKVRIVNLLDKNGDLSRVLGVIIDIDKSVHEWQQLLEKSKTDSLTGVYNKQTTEDLIKTVIEMDARARHAMFIVDIDDFKAINDTYGHRVGDIVLQTLAAKMKQLFRADDIIGRIGGDEFMVLMKNVKFDEMVQMKGMAMQNMFDKILYNDDRIDSSSVRVSGSIGISVYPDHGTNYIELYKNADAALYNSKNSGKKQYSMFRKPAK